MPRVAPSLVNRYRDERDRMVKALSSKDRELFRGYDERFKILLVRHLITGSFAGWALAVIATALVIVTTLWRWLGKVRRSAMEALAAVFPRQAFHNLAKIANIMVLALVPRLYLMNRVVAVERQSQDHPATFAQWAS